MRRAILIVVVALALAGCALPQETGRGGGDRKETGQQEPAMGWKWANFLILAAGLGYLIRKHAPALFAQQTREIEEALHEAARAKKDAEERAANIETRFAGLRAEIENLRRAAQVEIAAEGERIRMDTERHLERIQTQATQEIELMTSASRDQLRKYAALLALDMAEQRIHSRLTKDVQEDLADGFLQDLRSRPMPGLMARQ